MNRHHRPPPPNRQLKFDEDEMARIRDVCARLNTSMPDFIRFATLAACDEVDGIDRVMFRTGGPSESEVTWVLGRRVTSR